MRGFRFFYRFTIDTNLTQEEIKKRLFKVMVPYKMVRWSSPPERYEGKLDGSIFKMKKIRRVRGEGETPLIKGIIRNSVIDFSAEAWEVLSSAALVIMLLIAPFLLSFFTGIKLTGSMKAYYLCFIFVFVCGFFFAIQKYKSNLAKDEIVLKELFK